MSTQTRRTPAIGGRGYVLYDPDGCVLTADDGFADIVGINPDELVGMNYTAYTHPDDVLWNDQLRRDVIAGGREANALTKPYLRPDGIVVWCQLIARREEFKNAEDETVVVYPTDAVVIANLGYASRQEVIQFGEVLQLRQQVEALRAHLFEQRDVIHHMKACMTRSWTALATSNEVMQDACDALAGGVKDRRIDPETYALRVEAAAQATGEIISQVLEDLREIGD